MKGRLSFSRMAVTEWFLLPTLAIAVRVTPATWTNNVEKWNEVWLFGLSLRFGFWEGNAVLLIRGKSVPKPESFWTKFMRNNPNWELTKERP